MPETHENGPNESRLDRMERLMANLAEGHRWFDEEYKGLLAAQTKLTETLGRLIEDRKKRPEDLN